MRPPACLILLLVPVAAVGCSHAAAPPPPSPASPFYATIRDYTPEEALKMKSVPQASYFGYCDEHGTLTSASNRKAAVTDWVEAHNDRYHRGNGSLYWGRVYDGR